MVTEIIRVTFDVQTIANLDSSTEFSEFMALVHEYCPKSWTYSIFSFGSPGPLSTMSCLWCYSSDPGRSKTMVCSLCPARQQRTVRS